MVSIWISKLSKLKVSFNSESVKVSKTCKGGSIVSEKLNYWVDVLSEMFVAEMEKLPK